MEFKSSEDAHHSQIQEELPGPKLQPQIKSSFSFMTQEDKVLYEAF